MRTTPKDLDSPCWDVKGLRMFDDCWLHPGPQNGKGYVRMRFNGSRDKQLAHRVVYEYIKGPIPSGLQLDHLCRVRNCVNPEHLEPVTAKENILRGIGVSAINAKKRFCKRGHEFTIENTIRVPSRPGIRQCRICENFRDRRRYHKNKQCAQHQKI